MSASTLPINSAQNGGAIVKETICAGAPALETICKGDSARYPSLAHLVTEYLSPNPKNSIAEWTGPLGYDVILDAVTQAKPRLTRGEVCLVMEYLKKSDVFGLAELKKAAAGKGQAIPLALTKFLENCKLEKSLPVDIDVEMQTDLAEYFSQEAMRPFPATRTATVPNPFVPFLPPIQVTIPGIRKVTDLFSLYWRPKGMTFDMAQQLAWKHKAGLEYLDEATWEVLVTTPTFVDCWIAFPNDVFGRNKTFQEQEALIPFGFELPRALDAVFCTFVRFACTGEKILSQEHSWTFTICQERTVDEVPPCDELPPCRLGLMVGGFGEALSGRNYLRNRLLVTSIQLLRSGTQNVGVAPVRKYSVGT